MFSKQLAKSLCDYAVMAALGLSVPAFGQPNLISATFLGGSGDQYAYGIAIQDNGVYIGGYYNGPVAKYAIPVAPGATPLWTQTLNGAFFFGIGTTPGTIYAVGEALPPTCGASDGVGDTEGKTVLSRYDAGTGNALGCQSSNFFPYRGGESYSSATVYASNIYAAGTAETCGFGNNTFLLTKFDLSGVTMGTAVETGVTIGQFNCIGDSHASGLAQLNGFLYVVGASKISGEDGVLRPVLLKYGPDLTRQWKARPADVSGNFYAVSGFGGAIYAVGTASVNGGDFLIEKYDEAGNRTWSHTSGGSGDDELFGVVGIGTRLFAVGYTTSQGAGGQDMVILEIDPASGNTISTTLYGGSYDDAAYGASTDGADLYVAGKSASFASVDGNQLGQNDMVLLRYGLGPTYSICPLYDTERPVKSGSTIPIRLQLCDHDGNNLSSADITVHASNITKISDSVSGAADDPGNANPDGDFRFDATLGGTGGYIFNLSTKGLATGGYLLNFTASGDTSSYNAPFAVR